MTTAPPTFELLPRDLSAYRKGNTGIDYVHRFESGRPGPHVLVTGHPFVDVWQAVKPSVVGIRSWPSVPRGTDWKTGVCAALRWGEPADGARRVLGAVRSFRDLETPLIGAVEELIDFVTA